MIRKVTLVLVVLGAALAVASAGKAKRAPQVCTPFKTSGVKLFYDTLGYSWTCSAAKAWIVKLAADRVGASAASIPLKNGPTGYHCIATPRKQSLAVSGTCFKGTLAFPGTGFAWLPE